MDPPSLQHVVALPYPGRGHINAMLNLCRHLLDRAGGRLLLTFVVTEEWLGLLGPASCTDTGLRFRTIPNVIPSEHNRGADFLGFIEAVFTRMEVPFEELLGQFQKEQQQGAPPLRGIISDTFLPWAVAVGNRREIPVYSLFPMSACFFWVASHIHRIHSHHQQLPHVLSEKPDDNLDFVPGITSLRMTDFSSVCSEGKVLEILLQSISWASRAKCLLLTTFYELEPRVLDALQQKLPFPVRAVGPSIPHMELHEKPDVVVQNGSGSNYLNWLDSQPSRSVLYVSLGSFLFVSGEQMDEIASGLRISGVRFLWVSRRDGTRMQELGGSAGRVVPWCDQLKVLCHPAVGGFLTHCGWNSTLEAVYAGVPMLTFPINWDQPTDSRLIVEEWKVGLSVREEEEAAAAFVSREAIARVVRRLMDSEGKESKALRRRAEELTEASRRAVQVGGTSMVGLDDLIAQIQSQSTEAK